MLYSCMTIAFKTHTVVVLHYYRLPGPGPCQDTGLPQQDNTCCPIKWGSSELIWFMNNSHKVDYDLTNP